MADMRDRIAEIIRNANMTANPLSQFGYAEADALLANGDILSEWISVEDRLPEGECLAVSMQKGHSYKEMLVGYVYADAYSDTLYTAESDGEVLRNVTHWMPLPKPPKAPEEKGNETVQLP